MNTIDNMVTDELLQFVKAQYGAGMKPDDLLKALVAHGGWDEADVCEAYEKLGIIKKPAQTLSPMSATAPVARPAPPVSQPTPRVVPPAVTQTGNQPTRLASPTIGITSLATQTQAQRPASPLAQAIAYATKTTDRTPPQPFRQTAPPAVRREFAKPSAPTPASGSLLLPPAPTNVSPNTVSTLQQIKAVSPLQPAPTPVPHDAPTPAETRDVPASLRQSTESADGVQQTAAEDTDDFLGIFKAVSDSKNDALAETLRSATPLQPRAGQISASSQPLPASPGAVSSAISRTPSVMTGDATPRGGAKRPEITPHIDPDEQLFGPIKFSVTNALLNEVQTEKISSRNANTKRAIDVPATGAQKDQATDWSVQKFLAERSSPSYVKEITPPVTTMADIKYGAPAQASAANAAQPDIAVSPAHAFPLARQTVAVASDGVMGQSSGVLGKIELNLGALTSLPTSPIEASIRKNETHPPFAGSPDIPLGAKGSVGSSPVVSGRPVTRTMASDLLLQKEHKESERTIPPPQHSLVSPAVPVPASPHPDPIRNSGPTPTVPPPVNTPDAPNKLLSQPASVPVPTTPVEVPTISAQTGNAQDSKEEPMIVSMQSVVLKEHKGEFVGMEGEHSVTDVRSSQVVKRLLGIAVGIIILLVLGAAGFLGWRAMTGGSPASLTEEAVRAFLSAPALFYHAGASADLEIADISPTASGNKSFFRFVISSDGIQKNASTGFGDGTHTVHLVGKVGVGTVATTSDVTAEVRVVGNKVYFHIIDVPDDAQVPRDVLSAYWIAIDLDEIVRELALRGSASVSGDYGVFGGGEGESLAALISAHPPFASGTLLDDDTVSGIPAYHIALLPKEDELLVIVGSIYKKIMRKELQMTGEERARFRGALKKTAAGLWVDKISRKPLKFELNVILDDEIVGSRYKGNIALSVETTLKDTPPTVTSPDSSITTAELGDRILDYRKNREIEERDAVRINTLNAVRAALDAYERRDGRYPIALSELYSAKFLSTTTIAEADLKAVAYASYVSNKSTAKASRCTYKSKTCTFAHLGISLEIPDNPLLGGDADLTTDVKGKDALGCQNEPARACYDVALSPSPAATNETPTIPSAP